MKGQEVEAGLRQNPNFPVYGSNLIESGHLRYSLRATACNWHGSLSGGKSGAGVWTAPGQRPRRQQANFHDQERGTILAAKQAFTTMLLAKEALKVAQDNLKNYRNRWTSSMPVTKMADLGKIDFERLDLQLAQYESDEQSAEMNLGQGSDQLQTLMGYEQPKRDFDITGDLVPPPVPDLTDLEQTSISQPSGLSSRAGGCPRCRCERKACLCQRHDGPDPRRGIRP